jgi:AcrR family transcriptional regulator
MPPPKPRGEGRPALIQAARREFDTVGYEGTNTNAIARRAGYAPQTFYRHFRDKLEVFIAVYDQWTDEEIGVIASASTPEEIAAAILAQHRKSKIFRRSLRDLTVRHPELAKARASSRDRQIEAICRRLPNYALLPRADQVARLLTFERLCDGLVEGDFKRLGVVDSDVLRLLVDEIRRSLTDKQRR